MKGGGKKNLRIKKGTKENNENRKDPLSLLTNSQRLYDKLLSVVLNIPGPMKMDLDRMRKMWQTSFKNVSVIHF